MARKGEVAFASRQLPRATSVLPSLSTSRRQWAAGSADGRNVSPTSITASTNFLTLFGSETGNYRLGDQVSHTTASAISSGVQPILLTLPTADICKISSFFRPLF